MSSPGEDSPDRRALERLETVAERLLDRVRELEGSLRESRERARKLESLLERFRSGEEDPAELSEEVERIRSENRELRRRLEEGRETVDRLLSRIRFLEGQR